MKQLLFLILLLGLQNVFAQSNNESLIKEREKYRKLAMDSRENGDFEDAIYYYRKLAETDTDTFMVAADAYSSMAIIYNYSLHDSSGSKIASEMEKYLIKKSIEKYPDYIDSYIARLNLYKYSDDKSGESELIKLAQEKFKNRWEIYFVLAYHYIYTDFLWPDSKEFDIVSNYLNKVLALNPNHFNTLLLYSVAYQDKEKIHNEYLKKLYNSAPGQFVKNQSENKNKCPYNVKSINDGYIGSDLTVGLSKKDCQLLNLK